MSAIYKLDEHEIYAKIPKRKKTKATKIVYV